MNKGLYQLGVKWEDQGVRNKSNSLGSGENGKGQQRAKSANVGKEIQDTSRHYCLRTNNHSPRGRFRFLETIHLTPSRLDLAKSAPGEGHRTTVPFVLSSGPPRKS